MEFVYKVSVCPVWSCPTNSCAAEMLKPLDVKITGSNYLSVQKELTADQIKYVHDRGFITEKINARCRAVL